MRTLHSIGRDYLAQVAAFAASLADRLIVPGVFLRSLGVTDFSAWGVVLAAGSLVSVLDLGVTRYLANKLVGQVEGGAKGDAAMLFSEALTIMLVIAVAAPVIVVGLGLGGAFATGQTAVDGVLVELLVPVSVALSLRMFISLFLVLFRANGAFRVETWAIAGSDLFRTACVVVALLLGFDLLVIAWVYAGATILTSLLYAPLALSRFREFSWRLRRPGAVTRREALRVAPGLGLSNGFNIAYTAIPTIILGLMQPGAAGLAQFILIRTLGNFARQMVNLFSAVFGLELARRAARSDHAGYAKVFAESGRFLAVQVAVGCAVLLVLGEPMFALWTGHAALFDLPMLAVAMAPLLILPSNLVILEALTYHNLPWTIIRARIAQTVVTVAAFFLVQVPESPLRLMIALSVGEIVGLSLPVAIAFLRVAPGVTAMQMWRQTARACLVCAACILALLPFRGLTPAHPAILVLTVATLTGVLLAIALFLFGIDRHRRSELMGLIAGKLKRRSGR